ncbi:MAG: SpoIIE family protein phosphatase [Rhodocyclaceae bacterium]|nr:SpoIIE family protein phosphatase [Rhodocyclaceae bacterium]MDZ4213799.1 SpoIIE family protein phosphatase [Rhodocyclaceae bacterium]
MTTQTRILTGAVESSFMEAVGVWIQAIFEEFAIGSDDAYRIDLCLEELVTNTLSYAAPEYQCARFDVRAAMTPQRVVINLIDGAQPYDPIASHRPKALVESLDECTIGGFGIALVLESASQCRYEYVDGTNHLELVFDLLQQARLPDHARQPVRGTDRRQAESDLHHDPERRTQNDRRVHGMLSRSDIFRDVPYADFEQLIVRHPIQQFACETVLLKPGDENDKVLIVLGGTLKIGLGTPDAGELFDVRIGGCVGEMSVIDRRPASAFVIANRETRLLIVDGDAFVQEFLAVPRISRNMLSALSERLRRHNDLVIKRVRLEAEMQLMQRDLGVAKEIQESLLPQAPLFPEEPRLDCTGRMCTAKEVGGDFYDAFMLDPDNLFFVIGDVCGKGLPAALFMVRAISALRAQSYGSHLEAGYTGNLIASLNKQLCTSNDRQQFLTAFCGILNLATGAIQYLNAGHNPPVITGADGSFVYLSEPINPIVGMIEGLAYEAGNTTLPAGGVLLLYTDGVTEAETHDQSMYEEDRLLACLNTAPDRKASALVTRIFDSVQAFVAGAPQSDDITVLAIGYRD